MSRYITIEEFSNLNGIEVTLVREFIDFGLIHSHLQQKGECLIIEDIDHALRLVRLYQDLGINKEGIEIILSMREQIIALSKELETLKYKAQRLEHEKQQKLVDFPHRIGLIIDHDDWL